MNLETFRALETLARRHRCPAAFRLALRSLLSPDDLAAVTVANEADAEASLRKAREASPEAVLNALKALGPGPHRVWQVQAQLGLVVGGRQGLGVKGILNSRLVGLRAGGLVTRDPDGRGWSAA